MTMWQDRSVYGSTSACTATFVVVGQNRRRQECLVFLPGFGLYSSDWMAGPPGQVWGLVQCISCILDALPARLRAGER